MDFHEEECTACKEFHMAPFGSRYNLGFHRKVPRYLVHHQGPLNIYVLKVVGYM